MVAVVVDHRAAPVRHSPAPASRSAATARRRRLAGGGCAFFAACAVWAQVGVTGRAGGGPLAVPGAGPTRPAAARIWVVRPGDTLWAIARQVQPSGDIRPLVDHLSHDVDNRPLQVGQRLALP